jgi:hypothetical protein
MAPVGDDSTWDEGSFIWNAPGTVDTMKGGCSIGPEVRIESGARASEDLHA